MSFTQCQEQIHITVKSYGLYVMGPKNDEPLVSPGMDDFHGVL